MSARAAKISVVFTAISLLTASSSYGADLSLRRVMLSSGGVGYFEYEAEVEGQANLGLDVPLSQVDDVLKSLVVLDNSGGIGTVDLPGRDNTRAVFGDLPFGPDALRSPLTYLNSLQGVEIAVAGPRPMTGRIVQAVVEPQTITGPPNTFSAPRTRVTLLGAEGMRQFVLEEADSIQVTDPVLRERIANAIESVRREAGQSTRHLTLRPTGTGKRAIRVGFVAAAPLWKSSYRLILPAKEGDKARLQGWAVLENQSASDWNGVALTLQYGNPVTFRQAIYNVYFVDRPEVPVEMLTRLLPDVDKRAREVSVARSAAGVSTMTSYATAAPAPAMLAGKLENSLAQANEASATEAADDTLFQVSTPVALAAGHTANVPILDHEISAERVTLAAGNTAHPLSAVRITNDTGASLPAGVLTLYSGTAAAFAGDARLGGLPAGESRLLLFAEDLRTSVERRSDAQTSLLSVTAANGTLRITRRNRQIVRVTITAPAQEPRKVLVEFPRFADQSLSLEGGAVPGTEQTATAWRVPQTLKAGENRTLVAYLDRDEISTVALTTGDVVVAQLLNEQKLSAAERASLANLVALRRDETQKREKVEQIKSQIATAEADEDRIRKNLQAATRGDALHGRMTTALDTEETRIVQLRQTLGKASEDAEAARRALAEAVANLKLGG